MSRVRAVGVQYNPINTMHHAEQSCSQTTPELEYCIWLGSLSQMLQCQISRTSEQAGRGFILRPGEIIGRGEELY